MIDLKSILKDYVGSVCKSSEFVQVLIANDNIVINVADTSLAIINLGFESGYYMAFDYVKTNISDEQTDIVEEVSFINNPIVFNKIINLWHNYEYMSKSLNTVASIEDLRLVPEYEELLSRKASDGGAFYKIPGNNLYENYILPVFAGFPVINKSDKIGIVVKRIDYGTLLMEYHIYKKKINKNIVIYFRTLDVDRKLIEEQFIIR